MSDKSFYKRGIVEAPELPPVTKKAANKVITRDFQAVMSRIIRTVPSFEKEIINKMELFADRASFWAPEQCWVELEVFLDKTLTKDVSAPWKFQISRIVRGEDSKLSDFFSNDD